MAVIGAGVAGLIVVLTVVFAPARPVGTAAVVDQAPAAKTVMVTVTPPAVTTVTAPPLPAVTVTYTPPKPAGIGPGTYLVGTDMEPGSYKSVGTDRGCYWARLRNDAGDIIANDLVNGPGPARFTARKGEFVQISMCEFVKV